MEGKELLHYKNWVVAGDVLNTKKYANKILKALKDKGFNVEGVNPNEQSKEVYKNLESVPYTIEVIDLCINSKVGIEVVKEAKKLGINKILIQPGAESEEILNFCKENAISVVESCALVELSNYSSR